MISGRASHGYLGDDVQGDDWAATGDLVQVTDDRVHFLGRRDDVINVGGEKFLPKQVEDELGALFSGQAFCVIGVPDPDGILGEVPILAIEGDTQLTISDVRESLNGRVPDYTFPRRLLCLDSFPRTDNGKIQRRLIRSAADSRAES